MKATLCALLAGASLLAVSSAANAQTTDDGLLGDCDDAQGCLVTALEGLVSGFTGAAGSDLWGWMLGGSQSAGTAGIANELTTIQSTLSTIETELGSGGAIVTAINQLTCATDSDWIAAGPATTINTAYEAYQNFLTDIEQGAEIALGEITASNTDTDTLYGWANSVVQGNTILHAMTELSNLSVKSSTTGGTISDCIKAKSITPVEFSMDDRPYYTAAVQPLQTYLLNLNTQAMVVLTEAYHIYVFGQCVTSNGGDGSNIPLACQSSNAGEVIPNLCPGNDLSTDCINPMTIYNNDFLEFTKAQFDTGGAPYSTDDHVLLNGVVSPNSTNTRYLMARSVETYNAAAGASCNDPSTTLCGPTIGPPGFSDMASVAVGAYGFGGGSGTGMWTPHTIEIFDSILNGNFDSAGATTLGEWLCTFGNDNADSTDCTQPQVAPGATLSGLPNGGGAGLENVSGKGFYFPASYDVDAFFNLQCFIDGNLPANITEGQPICNPTRGGLLLDFVSPSSIGCPDPIDPLIPPSAVVAADAVASRTMGIFKDFYAGSGCIPPGNNGEWQKGARPAYAPPLAFPETWHWPVLDLATITCPMGGTGLTNLNPALVPKLCGDAFDTWFETQVPQGPTMTTATADATLDQDDPNSNDGTGSRLRLFYSNHHVVVAFDSEALETFLDEEGLERAQLVLSSADRSSGRGSTWIQLLPLEETFEEGDGDQLEDYRGSGLGVTWKCAADYEVADFAQECVTEWPHRFARGYGSRARVPDGYRGKVTFDVTEDVRNGISAWVIKRRRGTASVAFHSREGAELLGDPSLAPTLLLIEDDEDLVAENAAD